ncbi:MAG: ATP-binding protein [Allorhizobium sp.]
MNAPYRAVFDAADWMRQAMMVVALRLRHEVALTRALRGQDRQEGFLGLFLSDDDAEAILAEASGRLRASGTAASAGEIAALQRKLSDLRQPHGIWARLATRFGLAEAELDLLLYAAAPAIDPRYGRVYGYLNDDMAKRHLTPALALRLLDHHDLDMLTLRRMLAADAPLIMAALILAGPERPFVECPLRVDESVLDRLLGGASMDGRLARYFDLLAVKGVEGEGEAKVLLACCPANQDPGAFAIETAASLGLDILLLEHGRFADLDRAGQAATLAACIREARLCDALPVLVGFDAAPLAERRDIAALISVPALIVTSKPALWDDAGLAASAVMMESVSAPRRQAILDDLFAEKPALDPALRRQLAGMPRLGLLPLARLVAGYNNPEALRSAALERMTSGLSGLARQVSTPHILDDLVLQPKALTALRGLVNNQQSATTVLSDWKLGAVLGKRPSTTVLFKGPSGTGKTMAAGALANEIGLGLFHVDLAGMVSKYIGETEKNLDRLFEAAASADIILFFDEADAVFGERTEIQDARDRYANLQTSYLLQRLESFDGMSILATNLQKNIDEAFLRRIDVVVDFPAPGEAERRLIWERIHLTDAPVNDDVDFEFLAKRMELTGAEIRNCWLDAAHRAAQRGTAITMDLILQAVGRELVKQGKPVRKTAFGESYARLRIDEVTS